MLPVDDGSARLLDLDGSFHALSRSGFELLQATLEEGPDAAASAIAASYAVDPARIRADLGVLLADLHGKGLIRASGEPVSPSPRARWGGRCIHAFAATPLSGSPAALLVFARLCFATFGWSETVAAWAEVLTNQARPPVRQPSAVDQIDRRVRSLAARLPGVDCKERALAAWTMLARAGVPATLVVGVHLYPLTGHCWCEAEGWVLTDDALYCRAYTPVACYGIDGPIYRAFKTGPRPAA